MNNCNVRLCFDILLDAWPTLAHLTRPWFESRFTAWRGCRKAEHFQGTKIWQVSEIIAFLHIRLARFDWSYEIRSTSEWMKWNSAGRGAWKSETCPPAIVYRRTCRGFPLLSHSPKIWMAFPDWIRQRVEHGLKIHCICITSFDPNHWRPIESLGFRFLQSPIFLEFRPTS
jgi:hypothetical protein